MRDSLLQLGAAYPDRRPGSSGDAALAARVGEVFKAAGFDVQRTTEEGRTVDGPTDLETVVGVRPGRSGRRIVVLAHRDALDSPGLAELSGTAALLELARIFRMQVPSEEVEPGAPARPQLVGRDLRKTLVLVSTSGGSGGGAGARAWARAQDAGNIDAVLVLGDLASAEWHKPWVVPWSNGRAQPPLGWLRTVEAAARQEVGEDPGGSRATAQWARRALPLTVSEQGEVNRAGLPGVLLQISGERGPADDAPRLAQALHHARARGAAGGHRARRGRPADAQRRDAPAVRGRAGRDRHAAQRAAGVERAADRPLPAAAGAAGGARRVLPRPPPPAARRRLVRLGARRRRRRAARAGRGCASSGSPARSRRRAGRCSPRACR